jgi:chaperone modulatory protein CbpM
MAQLVIESIEAQGGVLFSMSEICQRCGLHAELIIEMVEYGVVEPARVEAGQHWLFAGETLARLNRAQRLRRDLQLDLPGLALSLDLLDEIDALRQQVASLQHQLQQSRRGGAEARGDLEP